MSFLFLSFLFFIWTHGEKELHKFMEDLNNHQSNIKFTYTFSKNCVPFVDLDVQLSGGELTTNLHIKPTDRHQYSHFTSSHPNHTKCSITYSQALRVSRICYRECDFRKHISEMKTWFLRRGYPKNLVESEIKKFKFSHISNNKSQKRALKRIPLVVTYHPLFNSLGKVLSKNLNILYMDEEVKKVFYPGPMVSFRSARKVSSYLVRAKVYPLERTVGSFKCKKSRCQVCLNVNEADTFTSAVTKKTYKINHNFDCSDKCLIYLLTCKKCLIQYVGKTVDEFRYRWNNYKNNSRNYDCNQPCMQRHLYEHYSSAGHCGFLEHLAIILIDKTDPSDSLKREDYWRRTRHHMVLI